jgi:hypothetical protein
LEPRAAPAAPPIPEAARPLANASGRISSQSSKDAGLERRERTNLPASGASLMAEYERENQSESEKAVIGV